MIVDSDSDGMGDGWEVYYNLDPKDASDSDGDLDGDGLFNCDEYLCGTYPNDVDTDNDGFSDYYEVYYDMNPLEYDDTDDPTVYSLSTFSIAYQTVPFRKDRVYANFIATDDYDVESITVYYQINGGSWSSISINIESDDTYSILLAFLSEGSTINWYVEVTDVAGHTTVSNVQSYTVPSGGGGFPE